MALPKKEMEGYIEVMESLISRESQQIAFHLRQMHGIGFEFAWVEHGQKIFYTKRSSGKLVGLPVTATIALIHGIFEQMIDLSFFILRNRIFTTESEDHFSRGMIRVCAKRGSFAVPEVDSHLPVLEDFVEIPYGKELLTKHQIPVKWKNPGKITDSRTANLALQEILSQIPRAAMAHDQNRRIACLVVDENGDLLSWSVNQSYKNKTMHAEVIAVTEWLKGEKADPQMSFKIYCSLKPCKMCAGMMAEVLSQFPKIEIFYFENDPGSFAQNTALDRLEGVQRQVIEF